MIYRTHKEIMKDLIEEKRGDEKEREAKDE